MRKIGSHNMGKFLFSITCWYYSNYFRKIFRWSHQVIKKDDSHQLSSFFLWVTIGSHTQLCKRWLLLVLLYSLLLIFQPHNFCLLIFALVVHFDLNYKISLLFTIFWISKNFAIIYNQKSQIKITSLSKADCVIILSKNIFYKKYLTNLKLWFIINLDADKDYQYHK